MKNYLQLKLENFLNSLNFDLTQRKKSINDADYVNQNNLELNSKLLVKEKNNNLTFVLFLTIFSLFGFIQNASSQTTFAVGDLSIIGFNSNAPDNFAFVTWVDITNNTYIKFTDNGFLGTGSANASNNARGGENFVIWRNNTGSTIAAGTVITIQALTTNTGVCTGGSTSGLDGISASGDQIFAYQGVATSGTFPDWTSNANPTTFNGTILFGLNFGTSWMSSGAPTSNTSYLPSQLNVTNDNIALTTSGTTKGQYTGLRNNQSTLAAYKTSVNNSANWTTATGAGVITLNTTSFTTAVITPSVTLSVNTNDGTEAGTTAITVTATSSATVSGDQTVSLGVSGTNITSEDYTLSNTVITILNGQTTGSVTFTVTDDALVETTETATLTISSPSSGLTLGTTTSQEITITDNDVATNPTVELSVNSNTGTEVGTTVITVTATSSAAVSGDQTVSLGVAGTNITTGDYTLDNTVITILNGQTTGSVAFTVTDDALVETTETATLTISSPSSGLTLGTTTSQNIIITDNDIALAIDLSTYVRVGRYALPEPTRTAHPTNNVLCQEASGVTYNWDTDTLFIVGDGSTSVTQVSKTGELIDTMTLAQGSSPQGTDFYDSEGITYIGNGEFVMTEERDRQVVKFTYAAGTTLTRSNTQTVKLGTFVNNTGTEGLSYDPLTNGYIVLKEISPIGIFQTGIDFNTGTATNGSATTENSTNLFDPALLGVSDVADVFALSNIPALNGQSLYNNLLVLSQENARVVNVDRNGTILNTLQIVSDPGNPLDAPSQQPEGLTMDRNGVLYIVNENGGGDIDHPQLWVYEHSNVPNQAPTAIALANTTNSVLENTNTTAAIKISDILVTDDGLGTNTLSLSGADANFFQIINSALYIKAGTLFDYETKSSYSVTINVDDTTLGSTPDASVNFTLSVTDVVNEGTQVATVIVSEVAPWSSSNASVGADWFEITNNGTSALDITGWKVDDDSKSFSSALTLNGITSIAAGESVIFLESANPTTTIANFKSAWFGSNVPSNLQVGSYTGGSIGLSSGGDQVNIYDAGGNLRANVTFGISTTNVTFNNAIGLNNATISTLSQVGVNDAFKAKNDANQIGSPGTIGKLFISEVAPWASSNSPIGVDWFEVTNTKAVAVDITGWKMDDNSQSPAGAVALSGITSINPGESVIFMETNDLAGKTTAFLNNWFGTNPSSGIRIGNYTGSGVGLSNSGDQVNLYNATSSTPQASVLFGSSPTGTFATFDNAAGINGTTTAITQLSAIGINGAFIAANSASEIGSPGTIVTTPCATITATATPASSTVCAGSTTTVTVTATGGTLPYRVTGSALTVDGGTFNYTITDAKGCTTTASVTITETPLSDHTTTITACDSYIWNGETHTTSGIYTGTTTNCITEKLDLTITPSSIHTTTISTCDSYVWNGQTYITSGLYTGPTTNCVTEKLDLTLIHTPTTKIQLSQCGIRLAELNTPINAKSVINAQGYKFEVTNTTDNSVRYYENSSRYFLLTRLAGGTNYNTTYSVRVAVKMCSTIYGEYGDPCEVSTPKSPSSKVQESQCGKTLEKLSTPIIPDAVAGAQGYQFEVSYIENGQTVVREFPTTARYLILTRTDLVVKYNTAYTIRVASKFNNVYGNYGTPCTVTTPMIPPVTKIIETQCDSNLTTLDGTISAIQVDGIQGYEFEVTNLTTNVVRNYQTTSYAFRLTRLVGGASYGTTYSIRVRTKFEGSYGLHGDACKITTPNNGTAKGNSNNEFSKQETPAEQEEIAKTILLKAYPNPFTNVLKLDYTPMALGKVTTTIYDMTGKLIETRTFEATQTSNQEFGNNYATGIYMMKIAQGSDIQNIRIVKQ